MPRYHITISHPDLDAMRALVTEHHVNVEDHGQRRGQDGVHVVNAQATQEEIDALRSAGYTVERGRDLDAHEEALRDEVGKGNRYKRD